MVSPAPQEYAALVREALEFSFPPVVTRTKITDELPKPNLFNLVHIITGMRRSGKTFYVFQMIHELLKAGVARDRVFYFNFADERLAPAPSTLLNDVVDEYWRQVPAARAEGSYLFLDEVQEADGWQGFCQRIAEHERVTLVITGSTSKMSADEIASTFRGRSLECRMFPLSFREFCGFQDVDIPTSEELREHGAVSPQLRTQLEALFDRFLLEGGFPGVQRLSLGARISMLQSYMRDVVARDVVDRYPRVGISLATQVALFCLRNTGCDLSVNRLVDGLRAAGYRTSWETINETVRLFEQAHLIKLLPEFSVSLAPDSTAAPKVYAADAGLAYAVSRANQQDVGKRLETAAFIELLRRTSGRRIETITSFTVPSSRREKIDFLVGDSLASEPYALYQVTVDMGAEKTRAREIGSLTAAMKATRADEGTVITLREEGSAEMPEGHIDIVPAWKWMLLQERSDDG